MTFSDEDIKKYQEMCMRHFDDAVSDAQAIEEMNNLVFLVGLMFRSPKEIDMKRLSEETVAMPQKAKP